MRFLIGFLLIMSSCNSSEAKRNFYFSEFFELNTKGKYIGTVSVVAINNLESDRRFSNTLSLELALIDTFYEEQDFKNYSKKALSCSPSQMYGYWKQQTLDTAIDVKNNDKLLVYLSFHEGKCVINFISKISNGKINFFRNNKFEEIEFTSFKDSLKKWKSEKGG